MVKSIHEYCESSNCICTSFNVSFQLDVWMGVTGVSHPVDIRVPSHTLESFKSYLDSLDLDYSTMIEDVQVPDLDVPL